jgi:DNA invertase Pin-like site-specific DNA recombinase
MITQNLDRQLDGLKFDIMFEDKCSGKNIDRPQFDAMMKYLREGDTLTVHSLDRLSRNLGDLRQTVETLTDRGVLVKFLKENLVFKKDSNDHMSELLLNMLGCFAQFERQICLERQREGIQIAKARGAYKGRKPTLSAQQVIDLKALVEKGVSKTRVAKDFKISRETVYQYLKSSAPLEMGVTKGIELPASIQN